MDNGTFVNEEADQTNSFSEESSAVIAEIQNNAVDFFLLQFLNEDADVIGGAGAGAGGFSGGDFLVIDGTVEGGQVNDAEAEGLAVGAFFVR
ncbi:MAG: hypothetical protein HC904_14355 [Blastochloris sp.]|nr:hypothetical protein [Blastochloris sp.]